MGSTRSYSRKLIVCQLAILRHILLALALGLAGASLSRAQITPPLEIGWQTGGLQFEAGGTWGMEIASLGDLDGDDVSDIAVGHHAGGDLPGNDHLDGAIWILFLNPDGTVKRPQKISARSGGFEGPLGHYHRFGGAIASLDDLNGDGVTDIAVGAYGDQEGARENATNEPSPLGVGAVWILFLNQDGTVKDQQKIGASNFAGELLEEDGFGHSIANLGDLNGDGVVDIAVGAPGDDDGGKDRGAVWILYLDSLGTVKSYDKISQTEGDFQGPLVNEDWFGKSVATIGDLDRDGVRDIAVGATTSSTYRDVQQDEVWILHLRSDGTVKQQHRITGGNEGTYGDAFGGLLANQGHGFGYDVSAVGDLDGDSVPDLAVGAPLDNHVADNHGAVWILYLTEDGVVKAAQKLAAGLGLLSEVKRYASGFGRGLTAVADINGDGITELAVGTPGVGTQSRQGSIWILFHLATLPPALVVHEPSPNPATVGSDITVQAGIAAVGGIDKPEVKFRRGGDPSFFSSPMHLQDDGSYSFSIPAFAVGERGVEFSVSAENQLGYASESDIHSVAAQIPEGFDVQVPEGSTASDYRLFSVPADLNEKHARAVLEDDLGPYDPAHWRFYGLPRIGDPVELSEQDLICEPGHAFWMLTRDENVTVNTGPGTSLSTDSRYPVVLHKGWNLVGNPFNFEIPVSNLATRNAICGGPDAKNTHRCVRGEVIIPSLWKYDGTWVEETEAIRPFEGYATKTELSDTLWFDPDLTPSNVQQGAARARQQSLGEEGRRQLEALFSYESTDYGSTGNVTSVSAHPNPFFGSTTIEFELQETMTVTLAVYDVLGRRVATLLDDSRERAGQYAVAWDGRRQNGAKLSSGVYFYTISANDVETSRPIVLTR